jgi:hypothetical protein
LKKSSAEFDVGIENGAAIERERELEAVDRISGIQRGQEITAREKRRVFCRLARRQEHCSSPGGSISNVNVREGITWPAFREGPVWDPRCQELGTLRIVV